VPTYLNDQANPGNNFVTIQFVAPPSLANSYIVAVTTPVTADGASQDIVQALVYNSLGQPVPPGTAVTFTIETERLHDDHRNYECQWIATAYSPAQWQFRTGAGPGIDRRGADYLNDQANPGNNYVTIQFARASLFRQSRRGGAGGPVRRRWPSSGGGGSGTAATGPEVTIPVRQQFRLYGIVRQTG